jgi:hypothetical protein
MVAVGLISLSLNRVKIGIKAMMLMPDIRAKRAVKVALSKKDCGALASLLVMF